MAKAKYKVKATRDIVDAEQFIATDNPSSWPEFVQENPASATGYSYKSIEVINNNREGFEIANLDFVVTQSDGVVYPLNETSFYQEFENI